MRYTYKNYHTAQPLHSEEKDTNLKPVRGDKLYPYGSELVVVYSTEHEGEITVWVEQYRNGVNVGLHDWMGDSADD